MTIILILVTLSIVSRLLFVECRELIKAENKRLAALLERVQDTRCRRMALAAECVKMAKA